MPAGPTSRVHRNRPHRTPARRRGRHPTPRASTRRPRMFPPTRSASWCSPVTNSTPCVRWGCSPASSTPPCPSVRESQPSYLGTVIHKLPGIGSRNAPNLPAIAAAKPDLILGAVGAGAQSPQVYSALAAITPTVFTGASGTGWEDNLRGVGAATGRAAAADAIVDDFKARAEQTGAAHDAAHYQASIVQLTDKTVRVYGANNFPASVLRAVGADRPGVAAVHRQAVRRIRRQRRRTGGSSGFLGGRRRRRLRILRIPGR